MKKIVFFAFFGLILFFLALVNKDVKGRLNNISSWKIYQLDKQYKNTSLHFKLSYPQEWQVKEEEESVVWYSPKKQKILTVSWMHPDFVYDVEGVCRTGMCKKTSEALTVQNITIEISKPIFERQKALKLSDFYLQGELIDSNKPIIPIFITDILSVDDFKAVLTTFSFTD